MNGENDLSLIKESQMEEDSILLLQDSHDLNVSRTSSYKSRRSVADGEEVPIFGEDHPFRHISSREAAQNYDDLFTVSVKL